MRRDDSTATRADWSATFRPDVEGLRGLAVAPVVLYHAGVPGWSGGYVGVDVFFVLSGYLITGLLLRELRATGRLSLAAFYARRSRRILPAAALVLVVTLGASALLLPPLRLPGIALDGLWAALFSANVRFALQATDYFQAELAPSPLVHYWSLGVEEQFYLLWPALLLLAARGGDALRRTALVAAAVVAASLPLSLYLTATDQPWAFFLLPTRAWELGLGALLAVAEAANARLPSRAAAGAGWLGVALIAVAVASFGADTAFPGTAALLPTTGALLILAAGARPSRLAPPALLSMRVPRFLGRISYSLYLWSWPLVAIAGGMSDHALALTTRLVLAAAAVPLAALSHRLVEQPLRQGRVVGTVPRRNLAVAGALTLAVVAVSAAAYGGARLALGGGGAASLAERAALVPLTAGPLPADVQPPLASVRDDTTRSFRDKCHLDPFATRGAECAYGAPGSPVAVVLFGDSHAGHWFPAMDRVASARGWRLLARTKTACSAADVPVWNYFLNRAYPECAEWRENVLREIEADPPALVVIGGARTVAVVENGAVIQGAPRERAWATGLERTIRRIEAAGARVALLLDTPRPPGDAPTCLSAHLDDVSACATPRAAAIDEHWRARERAVATAAGAAVVDPTDWVCPVDPCPPVISSRLVFRDNHHLSTPFVELLAPRLAAALPAVP